MPLNLLGGIASGIANYAGVKEQNRANAREAEKARSFNQREALKNRQFQERLSNSAYQRATADMRLSGINPMLAYQQGGSSTPSGSSASGPAARMENAISPAVSSAMAATRLRKDLKMIDATIAQTNQGTRTGAAQENLYNSQAAQALEQTRLLGAQIGERQTRSEIAQDFGNVFSRYGPSNTMRELGRLGGILKYEGSSAISTGKALWDAGAASRRRWSAEGRRNRQRSPLLQGFKPRPKG